MTAITLVLICASIILMFPGAAGAQEDAPFPRPLARSAIALNALDDPINDSLLLGNGDLNGLLFAEGDDLVFRLTKNDVWDARLDAALNPPLPTLARLKELAAGDWENREYILPEGCDWQPPDAYHAHPYPCPRACGVVRVEGAGRAPLTARLDIQRATADVVTDYGRTRCYIAADENVLLWTLPPDAQVSLEPIASEDIPPAQIGGEEDLAWLTQSIPGDADWPGMSFAVACLTKRDRAAVAVATSLDSGEPLDAAIMLAKAALGGKQEELTRRHQETWRSFWAQSAVELTDETLEHTWYRSLYFLRCVSKPGVVSTGLFAGLLDDKPAWHGDYHTNYNIQQTFWAAYAANHVELAEPYERLIYDYLPRARWMAGRIFNSQGAYFPHVLFAYEPPDPERCEGAYGRQYIHHVWGFTLGVAPFTVQPLWWRYQYAPDAAYLESVAYPVLRDVAVFCADFIDTCDRAGGKVVLGPTVSPEHHGWTPHLERNRDGAFCIAYFHFAFDAAIEAASLLGRDEELVERWHAAKALLPDYPVYGAPPVVVDVAGAEPMTYNIPVPATPVFPAEQVTRDSSVDVQALFRRTIEGLEHNGNNAPVMLATVRARLAMSDAYDWLRTEIDRRTRPNGTLTLNRLDSGCGFNDFGHYTEMFGTALPITELVLQSVGGIVRVFPAWPERLPARFNRLRAEGGFLVSASQAGGTVESLTIESTVGGALRLATPWPACQVASQEDGPWRTLPTEEPVIRLGTQPGQVLSFRPVP